jgi:hypothetical protein
VHPAVAVAVAVALFVGLPVLVIGLAAAGPVGWVVAAAVLPLATLAVILWLGRPQPGDGQPPPG